MISWEWLYNIPTLIIIIILKGILSYLGKYANHPAAGVDGKNYMHTLDFYMNSGTGIVKSYMHACWVTQQKIFWMYIPVWDVLEKSHSLHFDYIRVLALAVSYKFHYWSLLLVLCSSINFNHKVPLVAENLLPFHTLGHWGIRGILQVVSERELNARAYWA